MSSGLAVKKRGCRDGVSRAQLSIKLTKMRDKNDRVEKDNTGQVTDYIKELSKNKGELLSKCSVAYVFF